MSQYSNYRYYPYGRPANPPTNHQPERIKFNVGGKDYETLRFRIMQFPDSMLARMINQPRESKLIEEGKRLYIDRDGDLFFHVLEYIKANTVAKSLIDSYRRLLIKEADFYQLPGMIHLLRYRSVFQVGDLVNVKECGEKYLDAVVYSRGDTEPVGHANTRICWLCRKQFLCDWCFHKSVTFVEYDVLLGEITEIYDQCAKVEFAYSNVLSGYCQTLTNDRVVYIHIPLAYLEMKANGAEKHLTNIDDY